MTIDDVGAALVVAQSVSLGVRVNVEVHSCSQRIRDPRSPDHGSAESNRPKLSLKRRTARQCLAQVPSKGEKCQGDQLDVLQRKGDADNGNGQHYG